VTPAGRAHTLRGMSIPKPTERRLGRAQITLAAIVVIGFFVALIYLFAARDATGNEGFREARLIMLGALTAGFSAVLGYYFGSTSGSALKTEMLANSTPTPNDPVTVTTTTMTETPPQQEQPR
jgi:hypothetical protein